MNKYILNAVTAVITLIILLSVPFYAKAQLPLETREDTLSSYDYYSRVYYQIESSEFSVNTIPLELYLTHILNGVTREAELRKTVNLKDLQSLSPDEINSTAYNEVESFKGNYYARKFDLWKQFQLTEVHLQLDKVLTIKKRLLQSASPSQKSRMFNFDLSAAIEAVSQGEFDFAVKLFTHLIEFYGYNNIDDLYYYRGESYYSTFQYALAYDGFAKVVSQYSSSQYYQKSLYRMLTLDFNRTNYQGVIENIGRFYKTDSEWTYRKDVIDFIIGASYFQLNNFPEAVKFLQTIPASSSYSLKSRYLTAHCYYIDEDYQLAADQLEKIVLDSDIHNPTAAEAALFIGDITLLQDNPESAWGYYNLIPHPTDIDQRLKDKFARALIGKAACRILRGEYTQADSLADLILQQYVTSEQVFMANCLKARTAKINNDLDNATELYAEILDHSGKKIELASYLLEKLKLIFLKNQLLEQEELYLQTGDERILDLYWKLRNESEVLLRKLTLAEVIEIDPEFAGYIEEKINVLNMIEEYNRLAEVVVEKQDIDIMEKYAAVFDTISDVATMVHFSGQNKIDELPDYYRITKNEYNKKQLDSLYSSISLELSEVEESLEVAASAVAVVDDESAPLQRANILAAMEETRLWRNALDDKISANYGKLKALPEYDISRWSHVAFHKTMVPGSDFDDLKAIQQRVKDIDDYLQALGYVVHKLEKYKYIQSQ